MNDVEVNIDTQQVLNLFASLNSKKQVKVHKQALKKGANILVKETRRLLKIRLKKGATSSKNRWNGKTMQSGIRARISKDGKEARVNILGDFRLKFFEMGTAERYLRKGRKGKHKIRAGARRGKIQRLNFFANAQRNTEKAIFNNMDELITQSILKVARQ